MSKKKVLLEKQSKIRWARLAGIKNDDQARQALRESQELEEMGGGYRKRSKGDEMIYEEPYMDEELDDFDDEEEMGGLEGEPEMDMGGDDFGGMDEPEMDMGPEDDLGGGMDMGGGSEGLAATLASAVADAIEGVLGVSVDVEGGGMGMEDPEMDMGPEDDLGGMDMDEPAPDVAGEPEVDDLDEPALEESDEALEENDEALEEDDALEEARARKIAQQVAKILLGRKKK